MKVICINDSWGSMPWPCPVAGECCDVVESLEFYGATYYELGGRFEDHSVFISSHFATVSDLDETVIHADTIHTLINN